MPEVEYHGAPWINRSKLEDFAVSPFYFIKRHVEKDPEYANGPEKPHLKLGRMMHCFALEGEAEFFKRYAEMPDAKSWGHPASNAYKAKRAEFELAAGGRELVSAEDLALIRKMRDAIMAHPTARSLLSDGSPEVTMRMKSLAFGGIGVQCRADWLNTKGCEATGGAPYLADIKTVDDLCGSGWESVWAKHVWNFGYHRQVAFYQGISEKLLGIDRMIYIAVSKTPPHDVLCAELDEVPIHIGRQQVLRALRQLRDCISSGDWPDGIPTGIHTTQFSNWQVREGMKDESL